MIICDQAQSCAVFSTPHVSWRQQEGSDRTDTQAILVREFVYALHHADTLMERRMRHLMRSVGMIHGFRIDPLTALSVEPTNQFCILTMLTCSMTCKWGLRMKNENRWDLMGKSTSHLNKLTPLLRGQHTARRHWSSLSWKTTVTLNFWTSHLDRKQFLGVPRLTMMSSGPKRVFALVIQNLHQGGCYWKTCFMEWSHSHYQSHDSAWTTGLLIILWKYVTTVRYLWGLNFMKNYFFNWSSA